MYVSTLYTHTHIPIYTYIYAPCRVNPSANRLELLSARLSTSRITYKVCRRRRVPAYSAAMTRKCIH